MGSRTPEKGHSAPDLPRPAAEALSNALRVLSERRAIERLWAREPALWRPNPAEQDEIEDRLGWLDLPRSMRSELDGLRAFADEVRAEGVRHLVLCGMGGSSLAPEVFRLTFGSQPGYPALIVLDSTDPLAVRRVDEGIDPAHSLFLISSKSGGTIEVMSFLAHFWELAGGQGSRFVAITDPGTSLEQLARERSFRRCFLNPPDIGGRYSALSLFGLVPAALLGLGLEQLLDSARREAEHCAILDVEGNPGAWLAAYVSGCARGLGRDKLTLLTTPGLESFGLWVEQLIAESTGKQGTGIVPVVGEAPGPVEAYGDDRCFVALRLEGDEVAALDATVQALSGQHPVVVHHFRDRYDLGAEMYRWEVATALTGVLLGIHPFDQPNVQESKDNTARVLKELDRSGALPDPPLDACIDAEDEPEIASFLAQSQPGDYLALQAYLTPTPEIEKRLQALRARLRDDLKLATTLGFGPRFLHSTGQLHKGGPASGIFVQLTGGSRSMSLAIPGRPYSFGDLIAAQALGDLESLASRGLRVARVDLGRDVPAGLDRLERAVATITEGL